MAPALRERRHHRNFLGGQLRRKGMLLADRRIAPTSRAIELGDHGLAVLDADLVDAILIAVESQYAPVATIVEGLERIQYGLRR